MNSASASRAFHAALSECEFGRTYYSLADMLAHYGGPLELGSQRKRDVFLETARHRGEVWVNNRIDRSLSARVGGVSRVGLLVTVSLRWWPSLEFLVESVGLAQGFGDKFQGLAFDERKTANPEFRHEPPFPTLDCHTREHLRICVDYAMDTMAAVLIRMEELL